MTKRNRMDGAQELVAGKPVPLLLGPGGTGGSHGFFKRDAFLAAVGEVRHVAGDCRAIADFDGSVGSLAAAANALEPVRHVIDTLVCSLEGVDAGIVGLLRVEGGGAKVCAFDGAV